MPDHIHMLVELPPTIALSQAVKTFKDGSGRAIRQTHPELQEWLWGDSFWAKGYFAESAIKLYIEHQHDRPNMAKQGSLGL